LVGTGVVDGDDLVLVQPDDADRLAELDEHHVALLQLVQVSDCFPRHGPLLCFWRSWTEAGSPAPRSIRCGPAPAAPAGGGGPARGRCARRAGRSGIRAAGR